jgi:aminopeptidase N
VPILNFWSIQSARYAVDTRDASGIGVSIYYDPHHPYNVARLQRAAHAALDYYRANFGPYQFRYARIVEFPGYASFAQAFAGTMPFSESIGFLGNFSDPDKIDYATYVAAHELSHQYWGHQEVSADMQGGTMMVETLAQYSALMVMKHLYGPDKIRRFLRYELDQYLASRGREAIEELPLARVENQPYIHYRKGAVALYLLQDRLGEDRVNAMLRGILDHYRFKGAPFSTSMDLVRGFHGLARNAQEHELVADLLETITLWDFKADGATTRKRPDGQWETTPTITAAKERDNGKGVATPVDLDQSVDIGLFTAQPGEGTFGKADVIAMQRQTIRNGKATITLLSARKPAYAGIDPYNMFIDRKSDDNVIAVTGS